MRLTSDIPVLALLTCGVLLGGCQSLPAGEPSLAPGTVEGARQAEKAGHYIIAAEQLKAIARQAPASQRDRIRLEAAADLLSAGQIAQAQKTLDLVPSSSLEPGLADRRAALAADLALAQGHPHAASRLLDGLRGHRLQPTLMAQVSAIRARILLKEQHPLGAVRALIRRDDLLVPGPALDQNREQIWGILSQLPPDRLAGAQVGTENPVLKGWLALAQIAQQTPQGSPQRAQALATWKARYPDHPASGAFLAALATSPPLPARLERVALLLPLTSSFSAAAQAVEDGFVGMAAVRPDAGSPKISVYDIGGDPNAVGRFYQQAVHDGAQVIVGPLGAAATQALVSSTALTVPTMLLTHTSAALNAPNGHIYQFGLPAQQEARQVAERAYVNGRRHAAVLYPDTDWGRRVAGAFSTYWQKLGGTVNASEPYTPGLSDYSAPVDQMLDITQSRQRRQMLQNLLGTKLAFESRRRQDVDFVFMLADAQDGRLIKPQLNYHHADHLPVYATSNVYTGTPDPIDDRDLDGVLFGDMPWELVGNGRVGRLRAALTGDAKYVNTPLDRLFALGVDSYALLPHLAELQADPSARFDGVTSTLSIGADGVVHRELVWARFYKGLPHLLDHFLKYRGRFADANGPTSGGSR